MTSDLIHVNIPFVVKNVLLCMRNFQFTKLSFKLFD